MISNTDSTGINMPHREYACQGMYKPHRRPAAMPTLDSALEDLLLRGDPQRVGNVAVDGHQRQVFLLDAREEVQADGDGRLRVLRQPEHDLVVFHPVPVAGDDAQDVVR